jgi:ssDNA-binding replication factor A large subunit
MFLACLFDIILSVQEEATRFVTVRNEENVKVKNIYLEDKTKRCKIALWRNLSEENIRPGDYVQVTDCITNTFRNEVSLSTTSRTAITVSYLCAF